MEKKLQDIVEECLRRGIVVSMTIGPEKQMAYEINGFSKSGTALIYAHDGKILCKTRYETMDEISDFHDLSLVALEWYLNYKNRTPFEAPDSKWAEYWVEKGIMKKTLSVTYTML